MWEWVDNRYAMIAKCKAYRLTWSDIINNGDCLTDLMRADGSLNGRISWPEIYAILDSDGTVIYVGKSGRPTDRLEQHIGQDDRRKTPTPVGQYILSNMPAAIGWEIIVYDAPGFAERDFIKRHAPWFNSTYASGYRKTPNPAPIIDDDGSGLYLNL